MPTFPSTIWQELDRARRGERAGWSAFVTRYQPAVHSFLRGRGLSEADAEDVAQEVFLHFVRGKILDDADPRHGRFRSLVLSVACNVLRHRRRDERAGKRGGGRRPVSLEGIDLAMPTPEDEADFDREWVARMVSSTLEELRSKHVSYHRALLLVLDGRSQAEIGKELGLTVPQVNNHVHRARDWVRGRIRGLVRESCLRSDESEAEMKHLDRYIDLSDKSGR